MLVLALSFSLCVESRLHITTHYPSFVFSSSLLSLSFFFLLFKKITFIMSEIKRKTKFLIEVSANKTKAKHHEKKNLATI
jgi:hypothetical protein